MGFFFTFKPQKFDLWSVHHLEYPGYYSRMPKKIIPLSASFILFVSLVGQKFLRLDLFTLSQASPIQASIVEGANLQPLVPIDRLLRVELIEKSLVPESTIKDDDMSDVKAYCMLEEKVPSIPLGGDVKIVHGKYGNYPDELGLFIWVYSSQCPANTYSIVNINYKDELASVIDCRDSSLSELAAHSAVQWSIDDVVAIEGLYDFAISGPGYFLVYCPSEGFHLTREGEFHWSRGFLENREGCFLWHNGDVSNPLGGPVFLDEVSDKLEPDGCFKNSKQCVAMLDLKDPMVKQFQYVDPTHFFVTIEGDLKKSTRSQIYSNARERLDDPERGPTGIRKWESIESLKFPIDCKNY
jgi:hypothetical protein